jgi:predicted RNase H-like HicB family nuclease
MLCGLLHNITFVWLSG